MQRIDGKWMPTVTDKGIFGFFGDYRYLSNFHLAPLTVDGLTYPTSEHAYMAQKSLDPTVREAFTRIGSPMDARRQGQLVQLRPDWEEVKVAAMLKVSQAKYANPELAAKLLATGDRYLEETNYWKDVIWGFCNGRGTNYLGRVLMSVRDELRGKPLTLPPALPLSDRPAGV